MRSIKIFAVCLMGILLGCIGALNLGAVPVSAEVSDFSCDYSVLLKGDEFFKFGATEVITYSEEEAETAGVPTGYENQVISVKNSGASLGIGLNFSAQKIPVALIDGLTVRVYLGVSTENTGNYPQVRISDPASSTAWVYLPGDGATVTGEWVTVNIPSTNFSKISKDGYFNKFELSVRSQGKIAFYIDSISLNLKKNDGIAPVITYDGGDTIEWYEGIPFETSATAYDLQDQCNVDVTYHFAEDTQFAEDGTLMQGAWQMTMVATDYFGNKTKKIFIVVVKMPDNTPPKILTAPQIMYATIGSLPILNPKATDENGEVTVTGAWSTGALDSKGKLTEGTHTYTITAIDFVGNKATHTVTVIVSTDSVFGDNFIDEGMPLNDGSDLNADVAFGCGSILTMVPAIPLLFATIWMLVKKKDE